MPPPRARPQLDDSRSEASSTKEKPNSATATALSSKARRLATGPTTTSSLRDVVSAAQSSGPPSNATLEGNQTIQWSSFDDAVLHGYRYEYRLNTPASFNKPYNQLVLSQSPIGRMSPTMARQKQQRRQGKDQLANAVRKHFNNFPIAENDVVVDFLYKVKNHDKNFRMRFAPQRPQR